MLKEEIKQYAGKIEPELIRIRRKLHQFPETARNEVKTCQIIVEELKKIQNLEIFCGLAGGTGVMAVLNGRKNPEEGENPKCILLRADIDALPVTEKNDLPFRSTHEGYMHACGHDAHAAWIIGSAMILSHFADSFCGTVKFVFQPGEEQGFGAAELINEDHVLENPTVDYALAAHNWPSIDSGKLGIARRYAFGCPGGFHVTITGKGGHGSWPHKAVNPIMAAAQICTMLPQIVSGRISAIEPAVISIGSIHAGKPGIGNVIPDTCSFSGTIRAVKEEVMEQLKQEIEHVISGCCSLYGTTYMYRCSYKYPVKNDETLIGPIEAAAKEILGEKQVSILEEDHLGGENFSEFSRRIPSLYLFFGTRNLKICEELDLHSPDYMLDESILKDASAVFASAVFKLLDVNR